MFECKEIVEALKGCYKKNSKEFEKAVIDYIKKFMVITYYKYCTLEEENIYIPSCSFKETLSCYGEAIGINEVIFDKKILQKLVNGDKDSLFIIFHELSHIEYNIQLFKGIATKNIIMQIKERLLNFYQEQENQDLEQEGFTSYYYTNYDIVTSEVEANLNAILLTVKFLHSNDIDETDFVQKYQKIYEKCERKKQITERYVGNNCMFNNYYLTVDEAFDFFIKDYPELLDKYTQLKVEYEVIDGIVVKKDNITYQDIGNNNSIYYQCKQHIKT